MSKEEIVEALKMALGRGEDLQKVMTSFYNSGYTQQDIEDAARIVQNPGSQNPQAVKPLPTNPQQKPVTTTAPTTTSSIPQNPTPQFNVGIPEPTEAQTTEPGVIQKVSSYGEVVGKPPSKAGTIVIFALIFFLLVLVGALVGMFLFKEEVANFFGAFVS